MSDMDMSSLSRLVPVTEANIGGALVPTCDARELHAYLGVKNVFANWIKARLAKYEFVENIDYTVDLFSFSKTNPRRGRAEINYHVPLDVAKELAMVENNETGRQVRRYFIEVERQRNAPRPPQPAPEPIQQRPWAERPISERNIELRTIDAIGHYGNHSLAWWYMTDVAKVADFPRSLLPAWRQSELMEMPKHVVEVTVTQGGKSN